MLTETSAVSARAAVARRRRARETRGIRDMSRVIRMKWSVRLCRKRGSFAPSAERLRDDVRLAEVNEGGSLHRNLRGQRARWTAAVLIQYAFVRGREKGRPFRESSRRGCQQLVQRHFDV